MMDHTKQILVQLDERTASQLEVVVPARTRKRSEFIRQARDFAKSWSDGGAAATSAIIPGANHFTIVDELTRPGTSMLNDIVAMAEQVAS